MKFVKEVRKFARMLCLPLALFPFSSSALVLPWEALDPFESWQDLSDFGTWVLPATAIGVASYKGDWMGLGQLGLGYATTQVGTGWGKRAFPKARPNGNCCQSSVSGHTSSAFSAAAFLHHRYGWAYGIPAYAGASLVGLARVKADKHYWEDTVAGAGIAIAMSYLFTRPYEPDGWNVLPKTDDDGFGLQLNKRF